MARQHSEATRGIIRTAAEFAREQGSGCVETEHLLLAMLDADIPAIIELFEAANPSEGSAAEAIRGDVERRLPPGGEFLPRGKIPLSPIVQQAADFAEEEAEAGDAPFVEPPHLLLGLIREERGLAADVLQELGYTVERLREKLDATAESAQENPASDVVAPSADPAELFKPPASEGVNGSHEGAVQTLVEVELGLDYKERTDDSRVYVPRTEGWTAHIKRGWDKLFCYLKYPDEDGFHLILNGEVYLQRGDEKYCLNCALRHGLATNDRLYWQRRKRKQPSQ